MSSTQDPRQAADRLLEKLRDFTESLDADERALLAALLRPGVELAYDGEEAAEVAGFATGSFADRLPRHLAEAVRDRDLRITGW